MLRFATIILAILLLVGLIAYSQLRPPTHMISGIIEGDEIRLGSRVGGRVRAVHVQEGERITAGDLLVELEPFDLKERQQEAEARLAEREAELRQLEHGFRGEERTQAKSRFEQLQARLDLLTAGPRPQEIEAGRGLLTVAEAERKLAEQEYQRYNKLSGTVAVAREELDRAIQRLEAAHAMVLVRKQELELLEEGTRQEEIREAQARVAEAKAAWELTEEGYRPEEIEQARAARDAAQATLQVINSQLAELSIVSPAAGVVEAMELQPGDIVAAGAPVLSIMDDRALWVRAYLPQNRVNLKLGQELTVTVDSYPDERFVGEVTFISRQAEFTPSNIQTTQERAKQVFRIKVTIKEPARELRPGMSANVLLP
jgi:multidrug resistance efflux pump